MTVCSGKIGPFALLLAGFVLWTAAFALIYLTQATGCRLDWDGIDLFGIVSLHRTVLVAVFVGACGLHFGLVFAFERSFAAARGCFAHQAGRILALAALAASLFCFSGVFWLTTC